MSNQILNQTFLKVLNRLILYNMRVIIETQSCLHIASVFFSIFFCFYIVSYFLSFSLVSLRI